VCVVVCRGVGAVELPLGPDALVEAANASRTARDPTAHAEILALRAAGAALGDSQLEGCSLVVTLEPCTMCAGAIGWAQIGRIVYGAEGIRSITFRSYAPRLVRSLRLVVADHVDYALKSTNRKVIMECFDQRNGCDDVLMVRDNLLTDTSISNIALWHEQHRRWYTPARPLLRGTHRAFLLRTGIIFEDSALTLDRLSEFSRIRLFNAMLAWGEIELPMVALLPLTAH